MPVSSMMRAAGGGIENRAVIAQRKSGDYAAVHGIEHDPRSAHRRVAGCGKEFGREQGNKKSHNRQDSLFYVDAS